MNNNNSPPRIEPGYLEKTREKFGKIIKDAGLSDTEVTVRVKPTTREEAAGMPGHRNLPIVLGKERVVEAKVMGVRGHAFTDTASEFVGTLDDVIKLELTSHRNRAIYIAALNATLNKLKMTEATIHCKRGEPAMCSEVLARQILEKHDKTKVGVIGFNLDFVKKQVEYFGAGNVRATDLNPDNIGKKVDGVEIKDGRTANEELINFADVVLFTGTTLVNGTFDYLYDRVRELGKDYLVFGVSASGPGELLNFKRACPYGRE